MRRMSFAYGREKFLPLVLITFVGVLVTKDISVFVDESGSFDPDERSSRFYIVCFVLHDQEKSISPWVEKLEEYFTDHGLQPGHCVHAGPLIRREGEYSDMLREDRKAIFRKMMAFIRNADIEYTCFVVDKHFDNSDNAIHDKLLQDINRFLVSHASDFNACGRLKVYYDNGQMQVKSLLREAFAMFSSIVEFVPNVHPEDYRLFQAADLICTMELIAAKMESGALSISEHRFFGSERDFRRNVLKQLRQKAI